MRLQKEERKWQKTKTKLRNTKTENPHVFEGNNGPKLSNFCEIFINTLKNLNNIQIQ